MLCSIHSVFFQMQWNVINLSKLYNSTIIYISIYIICFRYYV